MFSKIRLGEMNHRKHKRELEISFALEIITEFFRKDSKIKNIKILEFGSGNGFQIPYLQQIGDVIASDVYISNTISSINNVNFVECSITDAPFKRGQFNFKSCC